MELDDRYTKKVRFDSLLSVYDTATKSFWYHDDMLTMFGSGLKGTCLWDFFAKNGQITQADYADLKRLVLSLDDTVSVTYRVISFGVKGRYIFSFTYFDGKIMILMKLFDQGDLDKETIRYDDLTKLVHRRYFCEEIAAINRKNPDTMYALVYFDILRFKVINEMFGFSKGDALLMFIASELQSKTLPIVAACRVSADRFAFLADVTNRGIEDTINTFFSTIKSRVVPFELSFNAGVYMVSKTDESGNGMLDKAILAQRAIKGSYARSIHYFTETLRDEMLSEQELLGEMNHALTDGQFVVWYQPQYNHSTGKLVGAEALVRWIHPKKGMISPGLFIPVFEKTGLITKLDLNVFEQTTKFLRQCFDKGLPVVPVSVNFSKLDIFSPGFVDTLEEIRKAYDVPVEYLRIEITESVLIGDNDVVNNILRRLHDCGYIIEMDDFGSGYSSLNVLKDLDFDIIKLDMLFLENKNGSNRGGTILSSVINMAKWLNIPVIAEGVETLEQADYLRSIGCDYIQGYLYSKPLPQEAYEALVEKSALGVMTSQMKLIDTLNVPNFWDPASQETLIFSNYVGAACILCYERSTRKMDILRINQKYLREIGVNLSDREMVRVDPADTLDDVNKALYYATLERAIETGEEQECETWRQIKSDGGKPYCIRSSIAVLGKSDDQVLFYCMVRNITSEKLAYGAAIPVMGETEN